MSWIDQDGVQLAARVLLGAMKLPCPGPRVDLTCQIVSLALLRGCGASGIDQDGVQLAGRVLLGAMKLLCPGPRVDLTGQTVS